MFIAVEFDGETEVCKDLNEATEYVRDSFSEGDCTPNAIYESDVDGDPIEGGKEYGCNWGLTLEEL